LMLTAHIRLSELFSIGCVLCSILIVWYRRKKGYAHLHYTAD
ncbi:prolipoprotein diacylglyceryl transferase, partial [Bacillus thuringiensis]|nr:prolipoprotein diacylglyceryl transferase [Bacillus thuringiensis]